MSARRPRVLALALAASFAFFVLAPVGSSRPETTNPGGYETVRIVIMNNRVTISPNHARRAQVGIFLIANHTSGSRVFSLGDVTLTHHRGSGFIKKLAPGQSMRVLLTLEYRGPLPASVTVPGGKPKVLGTFIVT